MEQKETEEELNRMEVSDDDENVKLTPSTMEHVVKRPPRSPKVAMGPYYQFITTDLENMLWRGTALIFRHATYDRPTITFMAEVEVTFDWEILYENIFDMRAYRINLSIALPKGNNDEKVCWTMDWVDHSTSGSFYIAQYDQKWRGAFFSCNGFDATISREVAQGLTYNTVWNHLLSLHEENPLHLLIWGGDQNYNDFVIEDVPFLREWSQMPWSKRWIAEFSDESKNDVERYYFYNYAEHWARRPEMHKALGSIPSVMMWDDHDIFDGAGSYPPLLRESPVMTGLFEAAQKMRLLFQHHTTPEKARSHQLFGYRGHNFLARCGPHLAILGADGRTERDEQTVQDERTWDFIFDKLENDLTDVKHLIVITAIPLSFPRFKLAESVLDMWKKLTMRYLSMSPNQSTNSVFGLPEIYDDLLDEWTHRAHISERNRALVRFQDVAHRKRVRITFFSGDVHCCGVSRFRTSGKTDRSDVHDDKLMYQIISSAIVNRPPPRIAIRAAHFFAKTWYPVADTEEALMEFFPRAPESRARLFFKKLLPNRNWCYFEQCTSLEPSITSTVIEASFLERWFWPFIDFLLLLIGLSWILSWKKESGVSTVKYRARTSPILSSQLSSKLLDGDMQNKANNLMIRLWLESSKKKEDESKFASYDLIIPDLE